jgi:hypothetical protein
MNRSALPLVRGVWGRVRRWPTASCSPVSRKTRERQPLPSSVSTRWTVTARWAATPAPAQKRGTGRPVLIRQHLDRRDAAVIIDGDMGIFPADAAGAASPIAVNAMSHARRCGRAARCPDATCRRAPATRSDALWARRSSSEKAIRIPGEGISCRSIGERIAPATAPTLAHVGFQPRLRYRCCRPWGVGWSRRARCVARHRREDAGGECAGSSSGRPRGTRRRYSRGLVGAFCPGLHVFVAVFDGQ